MPGGQVVCQLKVTARSENEYLVLSELQTMDTALVVMVLDQLLHPPWHLSVVFENNELLAFAPYPLTQHARARSFGLISEAIYEHTGEMESYAAVREMLWAQLTAACVIGA